MEKSLKLRNWFVAIFLILNSTSTLANYNCSGQVTRILEWPSKCNGLLAYQTTASNGKWICSVSTKTETLILMAYAAQKQVNVRLDTAVASSCEVVDHYHRPMYVSVND